MTDSTTRLRRSELAVPAASPKMIRKSAESDADLVFLDLEDATAPPLKEEARKNAIEGLKTLDWGRTLRAVRVNSADTRWAADDLVEIVTQAHEHLDIVIIPKPYAPRDIWFFETLLDQLEQKLGIEPKIKFEALIEEAQALACVEEIAACSPRLEALILGFGDLAASLGFRVGHETTPEDDVPGRSVARGPRAHDRGLPRQRARRHRRPLRQLHEARRPTAASAAGPARSARWASGASTPRRSRSPTTSSRRVPRRSPSPRSQVEAYEKAAAGGEGAGSTGGMLVDAASLRLFKPMLDRARQTGRL